MQTARGSINGMTAADAPLVSELLALESCVLLLVLAFHAADAEVAACASVATAAVSGSALEARTGARARTEQKVGGRWGVGR